MRRPIFATSLLPCALAVAMGATDVAAQDPDSAVTAHTDSAHARLGPPIRQIATAAAVSKEPLGSINGIRELPDGRVLVNDATSRRLLLLDTMMVVERVVLDSLSEREDTYGTDDGLLIAHRGDSTLFVDENALAMMVIDPRGEIVRVRAAPFVRGAFSSRSRRYGTPMTDARGRYVYQINARPAPPTRAPPPGVPWVPEFPDSAFIVALDMDTREIDTVGVIRIPTEEFRIRARPGGGYSFSTSRNPLPAPDLWAVLSDGSVAVIRAIDYRVEYLHRDDTWTSSGKIPYDWQPISEDEKRRIVDSVVAVETFRARTSYTTSVVRYVNTYRREYPPNFRAPDGYVPPNGFLRDWTMPPGVIFPERYIYGCALGEEPTVEQVGDDDPDDAADDERRISARAGMAVVGPPPRGRPSCIPQPVPNLARIPNPPRVRDVDVVSPKALPDFHPPFDQGAVLADMDGGLWIQTNQREAQRGGPIFDIISRDGELVDRIQVPRGYTIVGFGRGRVVYVATRDRGGVRLARVRLRE